MRRKRALGAAAAAGVRLNGLTNAWAPYLVHATRFLGRGGRLALVLPAELLHADYAAPVRNFLLRRFASVSVVTFEEAVFPGAMIDTVILLADPNGPAGLRVLRFPNAVDLDLTALTAPSAAPTGRWSKLRAPAAATTVLTDLEASGALMPFSEVASVDIGCVTGGSEFFVVSRSDARRLDLPAWSLRPVVPKPGILSGAILSDADMGSLADDEKCLLLVVDDPRCEQTASPLARYLNEGRKAGISDRYKCRSRSPWYLVPGVRTPHAFLSYMSHRAPRVVLNQAGVTSTNLVHQIRFGHPNDSSNRAVVALLHSSVCLLSSSRVAHTGVAS